MSHDAERLSVVRSWYPSMRNVRWLVVVLAGAALHLVVLFGAVTLVGDSGDPGGGEFGGLTLPLALVLVVAASAALGYVVDRAAPGARPGAAFSTVGASVFLGTAPAVPFGLLFGGPGPRGEVVFRLLVVVPLVFLVLAASVAGGVLVYGRRARRRPPDVQGARTVRPHPADEA